jgi:plasmid stabilization system protein ParE
VRCRARYDTLGNVAEWFDDEATPLPDPPEGLARPEGRWFSSAGTSFATYHVDVRYDRDQKELRMLRCERHVIYFRSVADGFEIVHVLHDRQLPRKHL